MCCCCCCSHVSIVAYGHGEFEVLLTPTEWIKVHAPQIANKVCVGSIQRPKHWTPPQKALMQWAQLLYAIEKS